MQIRPFKDDYQAVARLHGISIDELRDRDARSALADRWLAVENGEVVAAVTGRLRPDDRLFLVPSPAEPGVAAALAGHVGEVLRRSVSVGVDGDEQELIAALQRVGFEVEDTTERFEVPFDALLAIVRRSKRTSGYSVISAATADENRLFDLDTAIRNYVLGTDGWRGNRQWFLDELSASPPFEPSAYLVAVHEPVGDYVGLVRIWRNATGPRLGLLGVLPGHRSSTVAAMLLRPALEAASTWGWPSFKTETSLHQPALHHRMRKYGAVGTGTSVQLTRRPRQTP